MSDRETKSIASGGLCGYFKCIRYICHARSRLSSFQCPPTAAPVLSSVFKKRVGEAPVGRQASHRREVALPFHAFSSNRISFKSAACIQTQVDEGKRYGVMDLFGDLPPRQVKRRRRPQRHPTRRMRRPFSNLVPPPA